MRFGGAGKKLASASCIIALSVIVASCGSSTSRRSETNPQVYRLGERVPEGGGAYKVGKPYQIKGRWYHPSDDPVPQQVGIASWYGEYFHGRKTANGEWYDMERLSAAHPTMPLPSYARVTNLRNGNSVVVRVNDRGPYAHDRVIDMSHAAANRLGFKRQGTTRVKVTYIGEAPLDGDDPDMQFVDGGPRDSRPFNTASTVGKKSGGVDDTKIPEVRFVSSPLADELLAAGPLDDFSSDNATAVRVPNITKASTD